MMVCKYDGSYRMAIDQLNLVIVFHAKPDFAENQALYKFAGARYYSELDLYMPYHEVPFTEKAKSLTTFISHRGLHGVLSPSHWPRNGFRQLHLLVRIFLAGLSDK